MPPSSTGYVFGATNSSSVLSDPLNRDPYLPGSGQSGLNPDPLTPPTSSTTLTGSSSDAGTGALDQPSDAITPTFTSGYFTVGSTGQVSVDYLFDGGSYQGELAIFSLQGLDQFEPGTLDFIREIARRALSDSTEGHVVIRDRTEGARFSGELGEANYNAGDYLGVQTFTMTAGERFGIVLVPNGTVDEVYQDPMIEGDRRPLFSLVTANPNSAFHLGQIADLDGQGSAFVMEDLRTDGWSDRDYNDIIFQVQGAVGRAIGLSEVIDPAKEWRGSALGQTILTYAAAYDAPATVQPVVPPAPVAQQPLIGIIDTGFSPNNPDIDYSRLILGHDYVDGDSNPLFSPTSNDTAPIVGVTDDGEVNTEPGNNPFVPSPNDPTLVPGPLNEHGTDILGLIGATRNNGIGIDGLNDKAPLWLGRAIGSGKWAESLTEFVDQAKASKQPNAVVNLSFDLTQHNLDGSITTRYEFTPEERAAIEYARENHVLLVVAAGNDGDVMSVLGQASQEFDNIITVGAADGRHRADYSSYGDGLDILAPGGTIDTPIVSTVGSGIGTMSGTSVAAAQVTGAISQIWAANPGLSYRQVVDLVKSTATDLDAPGWDEETGAGLLNAGAALSLAIATKPQPYTPDPFSTPDTWELEGKVTPDERPVANPFYPTIAPTSFTGRVFVGTANVRSGPGTSYKVVDHKSRNQYVQFDAWTYGEKVTDYASGTPDQRWYRIAGTDQWMASAVVEGNAPGSTPLPKSGSSRFPWETAIDNEYARIENKPVAFAGDVLHIGKPTSGYLDTPRSPYGTTGKWRSYKVDAGGLYDLGSIYWSPGYDAVATWYGFTKQYEALGGPSSALGFPINGEYDYTYQGHPGRRLDYEGGWMFWSVATGDLVFFEPPNPNIPQPFLQPALKHKKELGNPTSGVIKYKPGVSYMLFEHGSVVSGPYGTFALTEPIRSKYLQTGGLGGRLGVPTSAAIDLGNGVTKQNFEGGYILFNGKTTTVYYTNNNAPSKPGSQPQRIAGAPNFNLPAYRQDNPLWRAGYAPASVSPPHPQLGSAKGNCTWYANGRLRQLGYDPAALDKLVRNASDWAKDAKAAGIPISHTPQVGAIAQWNGNHVAVVEKVNDDGTIDISESSYDPSGKADFLYRTRTISANKPSNYIIVPFKGTPPGSADSQPYLDLLGEAATTIQNLIDQGILSIQNLLNLIPQGGSMSTPSPFASWKIPITGKLLDGSVRTNNLFLEWADGKSRVFDPNKTTWLVIHGVQKDLPSGDVLNELPDLKNLAQAVDGYSATDQVLVLDWRSAAYSPGALDFPDPAIALSWIDSVTNGVVTTLNQWGIVGQKLNLIGHSYGSYVASEIAAKTSNGVDKLIALDPGNVAYRASFNNIGFNREVNLSNYSNWSWAFFGNGLFPFPYGDADIAKTADESFLVNFQDTAISSTVHGAVEKLFTRMLQDANNQQFDSLGDLFGLDRLNSSGKPWSIDYGSQWEANLISRVNGNSPTLIDIVPNP